MSTCPPARAFTYLPVDVLEAAGRALKQSATDTLQAVIRSPGRRGNPARRNTADADAEAGDGVGVAAPTPPQPRKPWLRVEERRAVAPGTPSRARPTLTHTAVVRLVAITQ